MGFSIHSSRTAAAPRSSARRLHPEETAQTDERAQAAYGRGVSESNRAAGRSGRGEGTCVARISFWLRRENMRARMTAPVWFGSSSSATRTAQAEP